jgi:BirA family biotin operon repressor/biotin-[acetyl-CoA-carboxylase] ligase
MDSTKSSSATSASSAVNSFDPRTLRRETFIADAEFHAELNSTNNRAAALAARGDIAMPLLVLAERQTAGRGRGANAWWSAPGSLTF